MIDMFEPVAIVFLSLFAAVQLYLALSAARLPLHVLRLPKHGAGQLREGPLQVSGTFEAITEPMQTLDGVPAAILETVRLVRGGWKPPTTKRWGRVVVKDAGGSTEIDVDRVILLGEVRRATLDSTRFRTLFPMLFKEGSQYDEAALAFTVEQRFIADGAQGFVAGVATPDVHPGEASYRGTAPPPIVLASSIDWPLIVASGTRRAVLAYLFAPALRHAMAALLALALALTVFGVDRWIASLAGLS